RAKRYPASGCRSSDSEETGFAPSSAGGHCRRGLRRVTKAAGDAPLATYYTCLRLRPWPKTAYRRWQKG
ncbi:MAG TPA: hypothetical protein VE175_12905, partial [Woeseiaceae bacterium]|nr:hypothetical protein [Woeseiaceae bacterium]